jgi:Icc-related predicted phosphoesterase
MHAKARKTVEIASHSEDYKRLFRENGNWAKRGLGKSLASNVTDRLEGLTRDFGFSARAGDLQILDGGWYVTHTGLLRLARRKKCCGIHVAAVPALCDSAANRFVLKATVFPCKSSVGFVGYGDADPSNVSALVRGAEMRVAETRAVNRALRKAYGIGLCSVEEIGSLSDGIEKLPPQNANGNGNGGGPKVRDRLCQIIRQHKLDPELVKAYAVDFCGTKTLREATREQVENFVQQLAYWAAKDRNALLCQLNSYAPPKQEVVA